MSDVGFDGGGKGGGDTGGGGGKGGGDSGGGSFFNDIGSMFSGDSGGSAPISSAPVSAGSDFSAPVSSGAGDFSMASPFDAGGNNFDYLGAGSSTADVGGLSQAGLVTSNASLGTGGAPTSDFSMASPFDAGGNNFDYLGAGSTPTVSGSGSIAPMTAMGSGGSVPVAAGGATAFASPNAGGGTTTPTGVNLTPSATGVGAGSVAPAAASAGSSGPADATSSWTDLLKKGLTNNPLGTALTAGGLAYNIYNGQKQTANQTALTNTAAQAAGNSTKLADAGIAQVGTNQANAADIGARGKDLEQYLATGALPPQYSQQVDQAINDAKTTAISNAAKNGQPTDPTKNTALAQQLAQIDGQRASMTSKVAETLFQAGAGLTNTSANIGNASASSLLSGGQNAANLSGQLYTTLTGIDSKQSEQTAKAIAALAQSLNSGAPTAKAA